jgi:hypothetical protein
MPGMFTTDELRYISSCDFNVTLHLKRQEHGSRTAVSMLHLTGGRQ